MSSDARNDGGTPVGAVERFEAPLLAIRMMAAVWALLYDMTPEQRATACFALDDDAERWDWDFIPKYGRGGLMVRRMTDRQKVMTQQLLESALSVEGYSRVVSIMAHENTLRTLQAPIFGPAVAEFRHPENYFLSIFGTPNIERTWGWRFVGHHVCLNFTIVGGRFVVPTPLLLGAEPARIGAFDPLRDDEERGFALLGALDDDQRSTAIISDVAPANFVSRVVQRLGDHEVPGDHELGFAHYRVPDDARQALTWHRHAPKGVGGESMNAVQRGLLKELIGGYVARLPGDVANRHLAAVDGLGLERFHFAWAGHPGAGKAHYYRVQGPGILVEFDNAQDDGNHIHTVWRDPDNDFGVDLLASHYAAEHDAFHRDRYESSSTPRQADAAGASHPLGGRD
jgi:hypothetical protein